MSSSSLKIQVPPNLNPEATAGFALRLERAAYDEHLTIDFSAVQDVKPFGALLIGAAIRRIVRKRLMFNLATNCTPPHAQTEPLRYLRNIGFFEFVGVKAGVAPETIFREATQSYIAISRIPKALMDETGNRLQNDIESISQQIAETFFTSAANAPMADVVGYCLREAIRNTFEHGQTEVVFVLVKVHDDSTIELALMDEGIGVHGSLSKVFPGSTARSLVEASLNPGITEYQGPETSDKWQNSGFGLYVLSSLGRRFGTFSISSNGWLLSLYGNQKKWSQVPMEGTLLRLRVRITEPEYFPNIREQIVREGEVLAKHIPGARVSASKGSRSGLAWS